MPHLILEICGLNEEELQSDPILKVAHDCVATSKLFDARRIKIRIYRTQDVSFGGKQKATIHAQLRMLPGRANQEVYDLCQTLVARLVALIPLEIEISVEAVVLNDKLLANSHFP